MSWLRRTDDETKHHYTEERLSAYLDGELPPQERSAVDQHLATCLACQWQLDSLRQTVQWTRTLPTVPVPRVFTIPPFTEAVPAPRHGLSLRPRRSFVPVLQGATALLALLLFFVAAGDILLTGVLPAAAPQPAAVMEQAPAVVVVTQEVGLPAAAATVPAEAEAMAAKAAPESGQEPTPVPAQPAEAPATAAEAVSVTKVPQMEAPMAASTATPEANVTGAMGLEPPAGKGGGEPPAATEAMTEARAAAPAPTATETMTLTAMLADTAQPAPTVMPTLELPTSPAATVVAEVQPPAPAAPQDQVHETSGSERPLYITWLRGVEFGLGVALVLLAAITLVAMGQRRKAK